MTIIVPDGSFYIGQTHLTLTCIISFKSATNIDALGPEDQDIMWFRGGTALIHNGSQVTVSNTRLSGFKLQYMSNLTLAPLSLMDTNFICRARVASIRPDFIAESEAGQFVTTITLQCKLATI